MQTYSVDGLNFHFPDDWCVGKYDDWSFYRNRFSKMRNGIKALDLLAVSPSRIAWLVEVKDYRRHSRTKPSKLPEEICQKIFDTLAALLPVKVNSDDTNEKVISAKILGAVKLRVVLHLEQPTTHSRLFPRAIDPAVVQMKLKQLMKPIDAHPWVASIEEMRNLEWDVSNS